MDRQMDIFDFIEKPPESEQKPPRTQFEQLFEKANEETEGFRYLWIGNSLKVLDRLLENLPQEAWI